MGASHSGFWAPVLHSQSNVIINNIVTIVEQTIIKPFWSFLANEQFMCLKKLQSTKGGLKLMQNRVLLMNEIPKSKLRAGFLLLEVFCFLTLSS